MIVLVTALVVWKNIYTFYLIFKFYRDGKMKAVILNIIFLLDYMMYYYFLYMAATDSIKSPINGPLWLIIIFIIISGCNILYDLKLLEVKE